MRQPAPTVPTLPTPATAPHGMPDMVPDPSEVAARLAFLQIEEADLALLRGVHAGLDQHAGAVVSAFYDHLKTVPALRQLLSDPLRFAHMREAQTAYFSSLSGGTIDDAYVRERVQVGLVHQRIGLEPQWYIGAYRKYLGELQPVLEALLAGRPEQLWPTFGALLKVVCFDLGLALDTYMQAGQRQLLELKNYSEQILGGMPSGVLVIDSARRVRTLNQAYGAMLGVALPDPQAAPLYPDFLPLAQLCDCVEAALVTPAYRQQLELSVVRPAQGTLQIRCEVQRMLLDGAHYVRLIVEDITERKHYEQKLRELASHDALTGLANRGLLLERLTQALSRARRTGRWAAVLFIDLDHFKEINDTLGHDAGDQVLVEVARRLGATVRAEDTVARLGGDEFVVLLADLAPGIEVEALAEKMLAALVQPMTVCDQPQLPKASIGISLYPRDGDDATLLLKCADAAMYGAKQQGGCSLRFHAAPPLPLKD
ncbi:diguanylate cyclase [Oxalobacteraceae bacterium]|nr:diguanylate cyclase [Oxalobacteraceae bacterium]